MRRIFALLLLAGCSDPAEATCDKLRGECKLDLCQNQRRECDEEATCLATQDLVEALWGSKCASALHECYLERRCEDHWKCDWVDCGEECDLAVRQTCGGG